MKSANGRKRFLLVLATAARRNRIFGSEEIRVLKQCCFSWWYVTKNLFFFFFSNKKSPLPVTAWAGVIWCAVSATCCSKAGCRCQMKWATFGIGFMQSAHWGIADSGPQPDCVQVGVSPNMLKQPGQLTLHLYLSINLILRFLGYGRFPAYQV